MRLYERLGFRVVATRGVYHLMEWTPEAAALLPQERIVGAAIRGMAAACRALDFPVVSGNVSLYNETEGKAILPTPAIGGVGAVAGGDRVQDAHGRHVGGLRRGGAEDQGGRGCERDQESGAAGAGGSRLRRRCRRRR